MNIKRYKVYANNKEFAEFVENWLSEVGWTKEELWRFLILEGVENPIQVKEFDKEKKSFKSLNLFGKEVEIVFENDSISVNNVD